MRLLLIVAIIALSIRSYFKFRALQTARRKMSFFKALGFSLTNDTAIAKYSESFALLSRLNFGAEIFTANFEGAEVTICNASQTKRYKPDQSEVSIFYFKTPEITQAHTLILPKSFHALSSVPATSLPLLDEVDYPTLSKHFVIRSQEKAVVKSLLSPQLMLALESLKEASIEFNGQGVIFSFPGNRLDPAQIKHLLQETHRFVDTLLAQVKHFNTANS